MRPDTISGATLTMCASTKASSVVEWESRSVHQRTPKYAATIAIPPAAHQTTHRPRRGSWREGTGAGGDPVAEGGEGEVGCAWDVSGIMVLAACARCTPILFYLATGRSV